jgi:hypothetical protein
VQCVSPCFRHAISLYRDGYCEKQEHKRRDEARFEGLRCELHISSLYLAALW